MTRARVPTRAKVFAVAYLSTVGVFWYVRQAFLEHAAGAARPVQSRDTLVWLWDNIELTKSEYREIGKCLKNSEWLSVMAHAYQPPASRRKNETTIGGTTLTRASSSCRTDD